MLTTKLLCVHHGLIYQKLAPLSFYKMWTKQTKDSSFILSTNLKTHLEEYIANILATVGKSRFQKEEVGKKDKIEERVLQISDPIHQIPQSKRCKPSARQSIMEPLPLDLVRTIQSLTFQVSEPACLRNKN